MDVFAVFYCMYKVLFEILTVSHIVMNCNTSAIDYNQLTALSNARAGLIAILAHVSGSIIDFVT